MHFACGHSSKLASKRPASSTRKALPSGKQTYLWKIAIFHRKTQYKLQSSIAMLNYQRVATVELFSLTSFSPRITRASGNLLWVCQRWNFTGLNDLNVVLQCLKVHPPWPHGHVSNHGMPLTSDDPKGISLIQKGFATILIHEFLRNIPKTWCFW